MRRFEAISGKRSGRARSDGQTHVAPGVSGDHHHGEAETGTTSSGRPVFVFSRTGPSAGPDGPATHLRRRARRTAREPPDEEAVVVLARSTQEGIVVNLPSLRAEVPELDALIAQLAAEG